MADRVFETVDVIQDFGKSLDRYSALAQQTTVSAQEIVASTDQQSIESRNLVQALQSSKDICRQVVSGARETQKAIDDLGKLAVQLKELAG